MFSVIFNPCNAGVLLWRGGGGGGGGGSGREAKADFYVRKALDAIFDFMKEADWGDCE